MRYEGAARNYPRKYKRRTGDVRPLTVLPVGSMSTRRVEGQVGCLPRTDGASVKEVNIMDLNEKPEATQAVLERQVVHNEKANVDAISALDARCEDRHLVVRRCQSRRNGPRAVVSPGISSHRPKTDDTQRSPYTAQGISL